MKSVAFKHLREKQFWWGREIWHQAALNVIVEKVNKHWVYINYLESVLKMPSFPWEMGKENNRVNFHRKTNSPSNKQHALDFHLSLRCNMHYTSAIIC